MKNKMLKLILCISALLVSVLSAAIGYGFMSDSAASFSIKFLCGLIFIMTPLLVIQLIIMLYKKDK